MGQWVSQSVNIEVFLYFEVVLTQDLYCYVCNQSLLIATFPASKVKRKLNCVVLWWVVLIASLIWLTWILSLCQRGVGP